MKAPRVGHTGDWHIGKSRTLPEYLARQDQMLNSIADIYLEYKIAVNLVSGDIFDGNTHKIFNAVKTEAERNLLLKHILFWDHKYPWVNIFTRGNHDDIIPESLSTLTWLKKLQDSKKFNRTFIVESPQYFYLDEHDLLIYALPYGGYSADDVRTILDELTLNYSKGHDAPPKYTVVMAHEKVVGCQSDTGWKCDDGFKFGDVNIKVDYWAFGDIHKCQPLNPSHTAWYCGSPIQHAFDELQPKGVLIVDMDDANEPQLVELVGIKPLITLDEIPENEDWPDGYIRLKVEKGKVLPRNLPDSVVQTVGYTDRQESLDLELGTELDVLVGLPEFLADLGFDDGEQKKGLDFAREAASQII